MLRRWPWRRGEFNEPSTGFRPRSCPPDGSSLHQVPTISVEAKASPPRFVDRPQTHAPVVEVELAPLPADHGKRLAGHLRRGLQASTLVPLDVELDGNPARKNEPNPLVTLTGHLGSKCFRRLGVE